MSYNTRRQGGVGRGMSQVMYHQQQSPGGPRSSAPARSSGPMQDNQGYSSGYMSQQQSQSVNYPPDNQGYSSQQQYQSVPPPPPPPASIQQQSPGPKPLHGILKTEAQSPSVAPPAAQQQQHQPPAKMPPSPSGAGDASQNPADTAADKANDEESEGGDAKPRPPWMKKKQLGLKVNKAAKRRRQNARLRKQLQPKNAIMVLNELVTGVKFTVQEHVNLSRLMFQVSTEIDGKVYSGQAMSKALARQIAAENALKAIILEKIKKSPVRLEPADKSGEEGEGAEGGEGEDKSMDVDDDVPWKSLTSFAIYKLFLEWQNEGISVPGTVGMPKAAALCGEEHVSKPMKKIPENPTERHPVMLLNHMQPGLEFVEVSRTGNSPDIAFTMQTIVNGKTYCGVGRNKKDAKKEAAKAALAGTWDIHYP